MFVKNSILKDFFAKSYVLKWYHQKEEEYEDDGKIASLLVESG